VAGDRAADSMPVGIAPQTQTDKGALRNGKGSLVGSFAASVSSSVGIYSATACTASLCVPFLSHTCSFTETRAWQQQCARQHGAPRQGRKTGPHKEKN